MTVQSSRFLLIEARLDQAMQQHELKCLVKAAKLVPGDFDILDVTRQSFDLEMMARYQAVFIGGTGDFSVAQDRPEWFEPLLELTRGLLTQNIPTLGLCYGFHLMALAVGGKVETRPDLEETGTYEVTLTEEGRQDPILSDLPHKFLAQQGHHDIVLDMPSGYVRLAESERCFWQAFRHEEKPFYGLQFHPELTRADFMDRMLAYSSSYASTPEVFKAIDEQTKETHNEVVILSFLDRIVGPTLQSKA